MTRLMCSKERQEVEAVKSELFRAGIRSEIRANPVANALGITRLEVFVHERDLVRAAKVRQGFQSPNDVDDAPNGFGVGRKINGTLDPDGADLDIEAEELPSVTVEAEGQEEQSAVSAVGASGAEGEFAQATALLEKEIEEMLVRETKLVDHCTALEEKVKALEASLAKSKTDFAEAASSRSKVEQQLAQASEARGSLEKEIRTLELSLKASREALETTEDRLESQTREVKTHQGRLSELKKEIASRDSQLERLAESLAQARAGIDEEKALRLAAEQKSSENAAVRKSLEQRLAQFEQLQGQLESRRRDEQQQMKAYLGTVNQLRNRLKAKLESTERL